MAAVTGGPAVQNESPDVASHGPVLPTPGKADAQNTKTIVKTIMKMKVPLKIRQETKNRKDVRAALVISR